MLVVLRCDDVKASAEFYASLGFGAGARYPFGRPNDGAGQFEPMQPAGSAYLSPTANSMGVLLLPRREVRGGFFFGGGLLRPLVPNLALASLNDDVKASAEFYASLGFGAGARYPFGRPNDGAGQFEPTQPAGSAYLSPAANSMGVLLLPRREGRGGFFFGGGLL